MFYQTAEYTWDNEPIVIEGVDYTDVERINAFIGDKFLIADYVNNGQYIDVDDDGNLEYGKLGLNAPYSFASFNTSNWRQIGNPCIYNGNVSIFTL